MKRLLLVTGAAVMLSAITVTLSGQSATETQQPAGAANPASGNVVKGPNGVVERIVTATGVTLIVPTFDPGILYDSGQENCPVRIVNASFDRPAQLMLTAQSKADSGPTLRLDYRNFSRKDIESVVFTGWIKVKDSPYQLDSVTYPFHFELSRKALLAKDIQATETLKLASNALGLDRIELSQVTYTDGTTWQPDRGGCVYLYMGNTERAKAW